MRFWNAEVNTEIEGVLEAIYAALPVSLIARLGGCADKGPSLGRRGGALLPRSGGENCSDNVQTPERGVELMMLALNSLLDWL